MPAVLRQQHIVDLAVTLTDGCKGRLSLDVQASQGFSVTHPTLNYHEGIELPREHVLCGVRQDQSVLRTAQRQEQGTKKRSIKWKERTNTNTCTTSIMLTCCSVYMQELYMSVE